jgi:hypothetical protein
MLSEPQFPWYHLPFDVAKDVYDNELNVGNLTKGLSKNDLKFLEETDSARMSQDDKLRKLRSKQQELLSVRIATQLATDIMTGKVLVFNWDGTHFSPRADTTLPRGQGAPHISATVGNLWLKDSGYNLVWSPVQISDRDAVNRDRYRSVYNLGFRYPSNSFHPLKGITKYAKMLGLDRQTLTNSLKEYRRDYPNDI